MSAQQIVLKYVLWLWEVNTPTAPNVIDLSERRRAIWLRRFTRPMDAA